MKRKMCKLNEELYGGVDVSTDKELDIVGAVPIDYADAVNLKRKKNKDLEKTYKELGKRQKEFIDKNHKREELSESLFEDLEASGEDGWGEDILEIFEEFLTAANEFSYELNNTVRGAYTGANTVDELIEYCNELGNKLSDAMNMLESGADTLQEAKEDSDEYVSGIAYIQGVGLDKARKWIKQGFFSDKELEKAKNAWLKKGSPDMSKPHKLPNKDKDDDMESDLWLKVHDELSANIDNEGPGGDVHKELKARRGERYNNIEITPEDDFIVYAATPEELDFAKKVADHYGVEFEGPTPVKTSKPEFKFKMKIRIPAEEK